jgi:two-component system chemotaxis response regulator CheY
MKILIIEDDGVSSSLLKAILSPIGECDLAFDGEAGVKAFTEALATGTPYHLVCIDIMLPKLDGQDVLKQIRRIEERNGIGGLDGVKTIMITALGDHKSIMEAFRSQCEGYIVKPIRKDKVLSRLRDLGMIGDAALASR